MTKALFSGKGERSSDSLGLIHSDVCGPMNTQARGGYQYFITFTDDFSRYGYIYLMRHKSEALEEFKEFKNEVQNQHGKSVKALRSDRGGEYFSQDFDELLKECGIVSQLTPPGTPQWNGVSERRNRNLLDMVRCMMSHTGLPTSFWGYALETAAFTLNRVPSKSVQKTPREMWTGKLPNMSFMKIWGCKAYDKHQMSTKLEPKSEKCTFEFLTNSEKGRNIELEEVEQQQVIEPEVEGISQVVEENPTDLETQPLRRSTRERHEPERYGFLITTHEIQNGFHVRKPNYDETFSPVAMFKSIRILLAVAAFHDYEIWPMDVKTAFLNGKLEEDVYMTQPEGFVTPENARKSKYIDKLLKRFSMEESKRGFLPMRHGISLSKEMCPSTPQERERMSQIPYASAIGSTMYAMICTRPDLLDALTMTSQYQANPGESHWTTVKNILKYLRRTKDVFLVYGGEEKLRIKGAVSWKSSKQDTVADSTTEAEYIAASEATKEAVWIKKFIIGLGVIPSISNDVDLYCDNNGAIAQAKEPISHQRSKHILRRFHLIREIIDRGDVEICKVHTDDNIADPLTKPLAQ
ncbi:hypothetical protein GQ457_16G019150 [Hibiscus cannabinus]